MEPVTRGFWSAARGGRREEDPKTDGSHRAGGGLGSESAHEHKRWRALWCAVRKWFQFFVRKSVWWLGEVFTRVTSL